MRIVSFVGVVALALSAPVAAQPVVTFDDATVRVEHVAAGAQVLWFAVAHDRGTWQPVVHRWTSVGEDVDQDRTVEFKAPRSIPPASIHAVVDLRTLNFKVVTGPGYRYRAEVQFPARDAIGKRTRTDDFLQDTRTVLEVIVGRPGSGAWVGRIFDGAANDLDGAQDGIVTAAFGSLRPVGANADRLVSLKPSDIVIVIDPGTLEFYASQITGSGN